MVTRKVLSIAALSVTLLLGQSLHAQFALARFGGAGVGRGNFGRGDFGRADGAGYHDFAGGDPWGHTDSSYYGDNAAQRPLATDGGLGRFVNSGEARNVATAHANPETFGATGAYGAHADAVRHAYDNHPYYDHRAFDTAWWNNHHYGYYYPWMGGSYCWGYTSWPMMAGFMGMSAANYPAAYDYGNNITYQGNSVYYGSQPAATAAEYSQQASNLAISAPAIPVPVQGAELPKLKAENEKDWKPLGVFSLVQGGQTDTSKLFQIMVNKEGHIRGNYYDTMSDEVKPISGAIDKKSMRAAWTVGNVKDVVYDTGLSNLLKAQSPVLIHYGKEKTQQWDLVRLEQPGKEKTATDKTAADKTTTSTEKATDQLDKTPQQIDSTI